MLHVTFKITFYSGSIMKIFSQKINKTLQPDCQSLLRSLFVEPQTKI